MSHGNLVLRNSISTCIFSCPFFCIVPSSILKKKTSHVQYTGFENTVSNFVRSTKNSEQL